MFLFGVEVLALGLLDCGCFFLDADLNGDSMAAIDELKLAFLLLDSVK